MTPVSDAFLAAFRGFEMSQITHVIDFDVDMSKSEWFEISLLNPDGMGDVGDNLPMTVDMTIRLRDLPVFAGIMLWDVTEMYLDAKQRVQGAGVDDPAVKAAASLSRTALLEAAGVSADE